jgi:hypothetical protein
LPGRDVESPTLLLNGADLFAWNADKGYLVDLDLPHVPTVLLDDPSGLAEATARWGSCVVKPRVGASGVGVVVVDGPGHEPVKRLGRGPWVVSELELIEPGLYLDVDPGPAEPFADMVANLSGRPGVLGV